MSEGVRKILELRLRGIDVDGTTRDICELLGDHAKRAVQERLLRVYRLAADHFMQPAGHDTQPEWIAPSVASQCLNQADETVKTEVRRRVRSVGRRRRRRDAPRMYDTLRPYSVGLERIEQCGIILPHLRTDLVPVACQSLEDSPDLYGSYLLTALSEPSRQLFSASLAVPKQQPSRRCEIRRHRGGQASAAPRGDVRPISGIGTPGCRPPLRRAFRLPVDPVAAPLKRIRREMHSEPTFVSPIGAPIHAHASRPKAPESDVERHVVLDLLCRMPQTRNDAVHIPRTDLPPGQPFESPARAHLQEDPLRIGEKFLDPGVEPHRLSELPRPVARVRRLMSGNPRSRPI